MKLAFNRSSSWPLNANRSSTEIVEPHEDIKQKGLYWKKEEKYLSFDWVLFLSLFIFLRRMRRKVCWININLCSKLEGVEGNPLKRSAMNFSIGIILDSHSKLYLVCEQTTGIKLKKHKIIYVLWSSFDVNKCMNAFLRSREERT